MKCQWCEKEFTPLKSWQKYCSPACRVAANRKRLPKDEVHTQETVLIRSFRCLQCGEVVNVYDPSDNRFKFCCVHCEKLYWKHPEKRKRHSTIPVSRLWKKRHCHRPFGQEALLLQ